ncbi:MAG: hypothetical protein FJX60_09675 [Alphaproteobacteria bacterium]|nr:hypothetical protein [Alphaproteobacteria bacterium]
MPLLEPSKGRFVPLFSSGPPPEKPVAEEVVRERAHKREIADAVAAARLEGRAVGAAETEARKDTEIAALRAEMNEKLERLVTEAVRQLNRQASADRERLDSAVRSIVEVIAGAEGRRLLAAGLASQILEAVSVLTASRPLTVTLSEDERAFIAERVPEFEAVLSSLQVRVLCRPNSPPAAATITYETGSVRIDLAGVTDRLLEAVKLRASEADYPLVEKEAE